MTIKSKKDNMKAGIEVLGEGFVMPAISEKYNREGIYGCTYRMNWRDGTVNHLMVFDIRTKLDGMSDRDFTVRSHQLAFEMEEHEILLDSTGYHC